MRSLATATAVAIIAAALSPISSAQSPERAGETQSRPPVEREGERDAHQSEQPARSLSLPVRIIEDPVEAERAEERAQRTEQHEADDLVAQQRAAIAAERAADAANDQVNIAWVQTVLAGVGTVALFWTLLLTRRSVKEAGRSADAAAAAVQAADRTAEKQLRAYVGIERITIYNVVAGRQPTVEIEITNFGQTPARRLTAWTEIEVLAFNEVNFLVNDTKESPRQTLQPTAKITIESKKDDTLTKTELENISSNFQKTYCFGRIQYWDVFDVERNVIFRHETINNSAPVTGRSMPLSAEGNEAD
ncbi:hypothetical protein [Roseicella sp. DB1501]|uniref:hypothetical protein n=1 Tax=Roseicella sp. DB1501 TaxID=2730925 RepID=UPI0014914843|nr:hypothetical protein [Roseicella sp. DB1501]NOG71540.1 hypothetical protein [Roseicella sp. DB1501]